MLTLTAGCATPAPPVAVLKFGGTCMATAASRARVVSEIARRQEAGYRVVVVVSAMGREGAPYATDTLLGLVRRECEDPSATDLAAAYVCGELLSASVTSALLRRQGWRSACLAGWQAGIVTTNRAGDALVTAVHPSRLLTLLDEAVIVVVAGSQGAAADGTLTTLGRGGSDTTAAALGIALAASLVDIYTDTPGVMTADPVHVPTARLVRSLTHRACLRMASLGAKVIHPRAVEIAARRPEIPLLVRGLGSAEPGTSVGCQDWLPDLHGRPAGVAVCRAESPDCFTSSLREPERGALGKGNTVRVSLVYEGEGAPEAWPAAAAALEGAGVPVLACLREEDCLSVWVPAVQGPAAARAIHAAAFGT